MERIKAIYLARMAAALHVQYHTNMLQRIANYGADALGLPAALVETYTQAVAAEQDFVNRPLRSAYTDTIEELDRQRDGIVSDILGRLKGAQYSSDITVRNAFPELKRQLIERYPASINAENYQKQTALVEGLLVDLEKQNRAVLKTLGIDALSEALKDVNSRFTQTFLSRTSERVRQSDSDLASLRAAVDDAYSLLVLELDYLAARTPAHLAAIDDPTEREKAAARREMAQRLVAETNEMVHYYNIHYLARTASPAPEDGKTDDGGVTDTDTDTPTDGDGKPATGPTDVTEVL